MEVPILLSLRAFAKYPRPRKVKHFGIEELGEKPVDKQNERHYNQSTCYGTDVTK